MKKGSEGEQIFGLWIGWLFCVSSLIGFFQDFVGVCDGLDICQLFSSVPVSFLILICSSRLYFAPLLSTCLRSLQVLGTWVFAFVVHD